MRFGEYARRWRAALAAVAEVEDYGEVLEQGRPYPLLSVAVPGEPWVLVTAGFHGDEQAGPLTLLRHGPEIVARARALGVGLRMFPCVNPSGFEARTRYNASGERPNNDFLQYEVAPGVWRGELRVGEPFLRHAPSDGVPKETAALRRALAALGTPSAALDIHQDNFITGPWFYAYVFGDREGYRTLAARSEALAPILRSALVDSGHEPGWEVWADEEGFIECHDGSITDHYRRLGTPLTAAIETTTDTPDEVADAINLIWVHGFIDLVGAHLGQALAGPSDARRG